MRRFTVAELDEAKRALAKIHLTVLSSTKPETALFLHQLKNIQSLLDPNTGSLRYALPPSGELFLRTNLNPQNALATGDLFFNPHNKVTALSNYTNHVYHLFLVLAVLRENQIEHSHELQFMQNNPPDTFLVSQKEISEILSVLNPAFIALLAAANAPTDSEHDALEDEHFEEICFLERYNTKKWNSGSSASPSGLFGAKDKRRAAQKPTQLASLEVECDLPSYGG